jgi:peptidoglycan/LPS O-acetylase OafA/YrhL
MKQRFLVLDGMRGIAAFAVLWTHAGIGYGVHYPFHGYLAVDFFFALSGFVLAYAYGEQIRTGLGFRAFALRRLIRLYPMIFAGGVLGALAFNPGWSGGWAKLFWFDASSFLLLPFGLAFRDSGFPVNGPIWSLFFELCANALYWAATRRPVDDAMRTVLLVAGVAALLGVISHLAGGLRYVGFASVFSVLAGFPRVAVPFAAGVLIFRYRLHEHVPRLPDFAAALGLAALLAMPDCGWWYDMICVVVGFPLLLCLGARAQETPALHRLWYWCGALSYPVYVVHEPVLRAVFRLHGSGVVAVALALVCAWALLRWYDEPLRRWLTRNVMRGELRQLQP